MQVPKAEVRQRILEAAIEEFLVSGYSRASMRNIADQAGITAGNIYAYFSSKDDLFDNILAPVVTKLNNLISMDIDADNLTSSLNILTKAITQVFLSNRSQFLILMNGTIDSKYQNSRQELVTLVRQRLTADLLPNLPPEANDPLLADTLAVAVTEGILNIFNKFGGDEERLRFLLTEFLLIVFNDIYMRL